MDVLKWSNITDQLGKALAVIVLVAVLATLATKAGRTFAKVFGLVAVVLILITLGGMAVSGNLLPAGERLATAFFGFF